MTRRHALVVGGTKGAGRSAVRAFSAEGCAVSVLGRTVPAEDGRLDNVDYWGADVADSAATGEAIRNIVQKHGVPHCMAFFQRFRGSGDAWTGEIEIGIRGTKDIIDLMVREFDLQNSSIVVVSSVNAEFIGRRVSPGYHVAKAALRQLVRYYAVVLGDRGVRVNGVSPGTFIKEEAEDHFRTRPDLLALYGRITPLGRMGRAAEIADVVVYLCGSGASFVTGQDITVDGGLTLRLQDDLAVELVIGEGK